MWAAQQRRDGGPCQVEHTAQVDVQDRLFLLGRNVPLRYTPRDDAGRGDRRVQPAPPVLRVGHGRLHGLRVAHVGDAHADPLRGASAVVGLIGQSGQLDLGAHRVGEGWVIGRLVHRENRPALLGQRQHGGRADPARGSGHHRNPPGRIAAHATTTGCHAQTCRMSAAPSSASRAAPSTAVAVVGSPRTPEVLAARTPSARNKGISSANCALTWPSG